MYLSVMSTYSAFGICLYAGYDFFSAGLMSSAFTLMLIGFVLLFIGQLSARRMEKQAFEQGYSSGIAMNEDFTQSLKEQKDKEK